jgi:hypothetical protein
VTVIKHYVLLEEKIGKMIGIFTKTKKVSEPQTLLLLTEMPKTSKCKERKAVNLIHTIIGKA